MISEEGQAGDSGPGAAASRGRSPSCRRGDEAICSGFGISESHVGREVH